MDTSYQDAGMLKAYGLVYSLLRQGVPIRWIIKQGKAFQQADFTAAGTDVKTLAAVPSHDYRGGPFVVDSANAAAAMPIITAWQASNPTTNVHLTNVPFMGDVARYLVAAPPGRDARPFSKISNTTSTLYDKDTDGDGVLDPVDTCPTVANPAQDLSTDVANCGKCGLVCAVTGGTPACVGGVCTVAACDAGFSDCNKLYPDGCEYVGSTCPPPECVSGADCDDKDPCTTDECTGGQCAHTATDCDGGSGTGTGTGTGATTATVGAGGAGGKSASSSGVGGAEGMSTSSVGAGGAKGTSGGATGPGDTGTCGCHAVGNPAPDQRAWLLLGAALVGTMGVRRSPRRRPSRRS